MHICYLSLRFLTVKHNTDVNWYVEYVRIQRLQVEATPSFIPSCVSGPVVSVSMYSLFNSLSAVSGLPGGNILLFFASTVLATNC